MKTPGILILLLLSIASAYAEDLSPLKDLKQYDVEIIIFEDARARYLSSESWAKTIKTEYLSAAEAKAIAENPTTVIADNLNSDNTALDGVAIKHFQSLPPAILNKQYKRIKASPEYNVLFYGAWRQAGLDKNQAFKINMSDLKNIARTATNNTLSGTFKLVLRRFLHIHIKLDYQQKTKLDANILITSADTSESNFRTGEKFPLKTAIKMPDRDSIAGNYLYQLDTHPISSHRRMRSKKLHYIDHPLVGILIQINPVEKP